MKAWILVLAIEMTCQAQPPAFEVASVKPNQPGVNARPGLQMQPSRLTATRMTLKGLILFAYGAHDFQISGGPGWLDSDRWDIVATTGGTANDEQQKKMLQTLLNDRFKLTIRREMKELPIYALVEAKNGPKLQANTNGEFDFKLEWVPDSANMPSLNGAKMEPNPEGASIFTAVQEQLGLRLESQKGPVEMLLIERAEKAEVN